MASYYVGIQIKEASGAHLTASFLGKKSEDEIAKVIDLIASHLTKMPFDNVSLVMDNEEMFGLEKNIRVRTCHFDISTESGRMVKDLAKELYDIYGQKDYSQNFHISATKNSVENDVIFNSSAVTGCKIYVKKLGTPDYIYSKALVK